MRETGTGSDGAERLVSSPCVELQSNVTRIQTMLDELGTRHLLIGGHAMAAYGRPRRTFDVDFAVDAAAHGVLRERMESNGYETLHDSPGYSNHAHPDPSIGRVDFVYVSGATADRLFGESREVTLEDGSRVKVPSPEHLAAMKIFAIKNDPSRTFSELADIAYLARVPGVDGESIAREFERHRMKELWNEIQRTR